MNKFNPSLGKRELKILNFAWARYTIANEFFDNICQNRHCYSVSCPLIVERKIFNLSRSSIRNYLKLLRDKRLLRRLTTNQKPTLYIITKKGFKAINKSNWIRSINSTPEEVQANIIKTNLAKCESPIEQIFYHHAWSFIPNLIAQYQIKAYCVDFFILDKNIIIECDGFDWHNNKEQMNKDYERENKLQELGYYVIRFTGSMIYNRPDQCVQKVLTITKQLPPN